MASRFETVDGECIEELKDKSENKNKKNSSEWWKNVLKKMGEWKKLASKFWKSTRTMSSTKDCRSFKHSEIQ